MKANKIRRFWRNKFGEASSDGESPDPFINSIPTHLYTYKDGTPYTKILDESSSLVPTDQVYQTILEFYEVPKNLANGDQICIFGNRVFNSYNATIEEIYEYTTSSGATKYCARVNIPYFHLENNDEIVLLNKTPEELVEYDFVLNKIVPFGYSFYINFKINYREVDSNGLTIWEKEEIVPYSNYFIRSMVNSLVTNDIRQIVVEPQVFKKYTPQSSTVEDQHEMRIDIHIVCAGEHSEGYRGIFQESRESAYCSFDQDSIDLLRQKHNMLLAMIGNPNDFDIINNNQTMAESINYLLSIVNNKIKDPLGLIIALS